jgi:hypothetical protein
MCDGTCQVFAKYELDHLIGSPDGGDLGKIRWEQNGMHGGQKEKIKSTGHM